MKLYFSDDELPPEKTAAMFLAGPSPRQASVADWRPEALALLEAMNFQGEVLIPIPKERFYGATQNTPGWTYVSQITWERRAREFADLIVFWLPRHIDRSREDLGMPAFTSNFELGEDLGTGKVLYGRPDDAEKCRYLDARVKSEGQQVHTRLDSLLEAASSLLGNGLPRKRGECFIPLHIWKTPAFKAWYAELVNAGNRLEWARVVATVGEKATLAAPFATVLHAHVYVTAESRVKSNEVLLSRPDTCAVAAIYRPADGPDSIVLVREFRTPVRNSEGFVYELPGGSSLNALLDPRECARQELQEETGLYLDDLSRFQKVGQRQVQATLCTHACTLFVVELSAQEYEILLKQAATRQALGEHGSSEKTYVELVSFDQLVTLPVDYATLGMALEAARVLTREKA